MKKIKVCKVKNYLPLDELKLHPNNPRAIRPERLLDLKASILKNGIYQPFLVWEKENIILAGNHRYLAIQELMAEGREFDNDMPVVMEACTEEQAQAILFQSNNTYADWVEEKLRSALLEAEEAGRNVKEFGFTSEFVDSLLNAAIKEAEVLIDEDPDIDDILGDDKAPKSSVKEDDFETLILPAEAHRRLVELLTEISKVEISGWEEGESFEDAVNYLCDHFHLGVKPAKKKKK